MVNNASTISKWKISPKGFWNVRVCLSSRVWWALCRTRTHALSCKNKLLKIHVKSQLAIMGLNREDGNALILYFSVFVSMCYLQTKTEKSHWSFPSSQIIWCISQWICIWEEPLLQRGLLTLLILLCTEVLDFRKAWFSLRWIINNCAIFFLALHCVSWYGFANQISHLFHLQSRALILEAHHSPPLQILVLKSKQATLREYHNSISEIYLILSG